MKKLGLPTAVMRLLVLFALTTPILAGTITENILSRSQSISDSSASTLLTSEAGKEVSTSPIPERAKDSSNMPSGTRSYSSAAGVKTYAFSNSHDFLKAANLMSDTTVSLSSVNFGRIPFQQMLIVSPRAGENNSVPSAQLPEPASLILIGTGLAALGIGMKKRKARK